MTLISTRNPGTNVIDWIYYEILIAWAKLCNFILGPEE